MEDQKIKLKDFLSTINHEVDSMVEMEEEGGLPHEKFLQWASDVLISTEEIEEDIQPSTLETRGQAIHGCHYLDTDNRLDLFITAYKRTSDLYTIPKSENEILVKRVNTFLERTINNKNDDISIDHKINNLGVLSTIKHFWDDVVNIRIFVLTNGLSSQEITEDLELDGKNIQVNIWDLKRFFNWKSSGKVDRSTDVNFTDYNIHSLKCSVGNNVDDFQVFLTIVPADVIADIYKAYGSKLLERNVRAFLSFKQLVNRNMLKTIEDEPERFLAYNNGLTSVASSAEFNNENYSEILSLNNFQIVNGGQTTNALFRAKYVHKLDISKISVAMKLCVLNESKVDELSPKISEFSNSQNRINRSDLAAHNNIYQEIEKLSRSVFAPSPENYQIDTKWFFERAKGSYADEVSMFKTVAKKKSFEKTYPRNQKIDKTLLAKCWGVWNQQVEDVSLGSEKYHKIFLENIEKEKRIFDKNDPQTSFQKLVAMIILYKETFRQIRKEDLGMGFPGVITNYTISWLSNLSEMRLDILEVWRKQSPPEEWYENIRILAPKVGEVLSTNFQDLNPSEVAKGRKSNGKSLWNFLIEKKLDLPVNFKKAKEKDKEIPVEFEKTKEQEEALQHLSNTSAEILSILNTWSKETGNLEGWQRKIIYSVGVAKNKGKEATPKQAVIVAKALKEAKSLGFKAETKQN